MMERDWNGPELLWSRVLPLIIRYSTNRDYRPYDLVEELESRGLFHCRGREKTAPVPWRPTIEEYIECRHSQNGLSRERMGEEALAFDAAVREVLDDLCAAGVIESRDGRLELAVEAHIIWGEPAAG